MNRNNLPAHAKYGPSSMDRIINCPGSVALSEQAPEQGDSEFAAEGTLAHDICERVLNARAYRAEDILSDSEIAELSDDMLPAVNVYVDYCTALMEEAKDYGIEETLVASAKLFGTADFIAVTKGENGHTLHIVDYKHGAGVMVSPENNRQMMTYAWLAMVDDDLCLLEMYPDIEVVELTIVQPRGMGEPVKVWQTDVFAIHAHAVEMLRAIELAERDDETLFLSSGDHCRWCRAKVICPKLSNDAAGIIETNPRDMSEEALSEALAMLGPLKMAITELETYAQKQAEAGVRIPGWKLVDKRATAKWTDPMGAEVFLRAQARANNYKVSDIIKPVLTTPAQARKLMQKDDAKAKLENLIESISSGVTLVPESDKRPEAITAGSMERMAKTMAAVNKLN